MAKKNILVIDDHEALLESIIRFLSLEGFKVYSAKNGAEGIQKAIQHKPDLIICDIGMPKMNGYEVYKTLEKNPSTSSIPFIFLTAKAQPKDFRAGLLLGADDYIIKPFELDELILSINKRLEKHKRLKQIDENKFKAVFQNPLTGVFLYQNNSFSLINEKFTNITGYTKNDLNSMDLSEILIGDQKKIINKFKMCINGIHETVQMKISFTGKDKKAILTEIYLRHVDINEENSVIGSIVNISEKNNIFGYKQNKSENIDIDNIIKYLFSTKRNDIAEEIINISQLLSFNILHQKDELMDKIKLTKREYEILRLICSGLTNYEIADKLYISNRTVDNHRSSILSKTKTKNTASLVAFAVGNKLVNPPTKQ